MKTAAMPWSWDDAFRNATAGAANGAVTGAMIGLLDPAGATLPLTTAIGTLAGVAGTLAGDGAGYLWDDEPDVPFASIPLYIFVTGLLLGTVLVFVSLPPARTGASPQAHVVAIAAVTGLIAAASARLIDDIRARRRSKDALLTDEFLDLQELEAIDRYRRAASDRSDEDSA